MRFNSVMVSTNLNSIISYSSTVVSKRILAWASNRLAVPYFWQ